MTEIVIYIVLAALLVASTHIWSAIKSGCFYSAMRREKPELLKKYIDNLHYVQTPFWYSLFGAFGIMLFALFRVMHPEVIWMSLLSAYLIAQGTSTMAGPIYQGFVNVGCGLPFIDTNENPSMELANPFTGKTKWIKRFWHGKRRVYLSFVGVAMIVVGIVLL
jgi:hypothetical protein